MGFDLSVGLVDTYQSILLKNPFLSVLLKKKANKSQRVSSKAFNIMYCTDNMCTEPRPSDLWFQPRKKIGKRYQMMCHLFCPLSFKVLHCFLTKLQKHSSHSVVNAVCVEGSIGMC